MDDEKMCSHSRFSFADDFFPLPLVEGEKGWTEGVKKKICFLFLLVPYSRLHLQVKMGFLLLVRPDVEASIEAEKKVRHGFIFRKRKHFRVVFLMMLEIVQRFHCWSSVLIAKFPRNKLPSASCLIINFSSSPPPISSFSYSYICFINQTLYTSWRFPHKCVSVRADRERWIQHIRRTSGGLSLGWRKHFLPWENSASGRCKNRSLFTRFLNLCEEIKFESILLMHEKREKKLLIT